MPSDRCRARLFAQFGLELTAVFAVRHPFAGQFEMLAGIQFGQIADDGNQFIPAAGVLEGQHPPAVRLEPQDGVAVFLVVIGDPLDGAGDLIPFMSAIVHD